MNRVVRLVLIFGIAAQAFSQVDHEKAYQIPESVEQTNTDEIFDEIMQSLSVDVKAEIDSASKGNGRRVEPKEKPGSGLSVQKDRLNDQTGSQAGHVLENLPDEVRRRVEKAMTEIEKRQKERRMQFKEPRRQAD